MYKKTLLLIFLLTFLLAVNGCTAAKKPLETPSPEKKILVPHISTIPFDTIEIKDTPEIVKNIAKDMAGKDMGTWLRVNNTIYVLVNQSGKTSSEEVEIAEILKKIPEENFIWLQITLNYKQSTGQEKIFVNEPLVAKFDFPSDEYISGVGFDFERQRNIWQNEPKDDKRISPHNTGNISTQPQPQPISLEIDTPVADQEVTAPFKVTGRLKNYNPDNNDSITVRLRDDTGQIIVEKSIVSNQISPDDTFETTISYPAPQNPVKGLVEAFLFSRATGTEENMVKVPVIMK